MEKSYSICMFIIGCIGFVGNILAIFSFTRRKNQRNFHLLMGCLAFYDLLFVINWLYHSLSGLVPSIKDTKFSQHFFLFLYPLAQIGFTGSTYFTVAVTIERFTTLCCSVSKFNNKISVWITFILPITVLALLCNVSRFFEFKVEELVLMDYDYNYDWESTYNDTENGNKTYFTIAPTDMRQNHHYTNYLLYFFIIFRSLVPYVLLITFCVIIYRKLSSISLSPHHSASAKNSTQPQGEEGGAQGGELILTQICLVIILIFLICRSIGFFFEGWEIVRKSLGKDSYPRYLENLSNLSQMMRLVSSSAKFYIYFIKHKCYEGRYTSSANNGTKMLDM